MKSNKKSKESLSKRASRSIKSEVPPSEADHTIRPGQGKDAVSNNDADKDLDNRSNKQRNKPSHP